MKDLELGDYLWYILQIIKIVDSLIARNIQYRTNTYVLKYYTHSVAL